MKASVYTYKINKGNLKLIEKKRSYNIDFKFDSNCFEEYLGKTVIKTSMYRAMSSALATSSKVSLERLRIAAKNENDYYHHIARFCLDIYDLSEEYIIIVEELSNEGENSNECNTVSNR